MKNLEFTTQEKFISLFWEEADYRDFLRITCEKKLAPLPFNRAKIASVLGISASFVTKVFSKKGHLSHEQILTLCQRFKFDETYTSAFLDKLSYSRAETKSLRDLFHRRIQTLFNSSFHTKAREVAPTEEKRQLLPPPANLLFYKVASVLKEKPHSITEIAERLRLNPAKIDIILGQMKPHFNIQTIEQNGKQKFFLSLENYNYSPRKPGSADLFELGMSLRRLAAYSMEMRNPIHIVDHHEHHVSGSYLVPLDEEQIRTLTVLFSQLTKKITDMNLNLKPTPESKYVGICFDLFDINI